VGILCDAFGISNWGKITCVETLLLVSISDSKCKEVFGKMMSIVDAYI
jgi:hypothetical protein